jgi:hypothetical protein
MLGMDRAVRKATACDLPPAARSAHPLAAPIPVALDVDIDDG